MGIPAVAMKGAQIYSGAVMGFLNQAQITTGLKTQIFVKRLNGVHRRPRVLGLMGETEHQTYKILDHKYLNYKPDFTVLNRIPNGAELLMHIVQSTQNIRFRAGLLKKLSAGCDNKVLGREFI